MHHWIDNKTKKILKVRNWCKKGEFTEVSEAWSWLSTSEQRLNLDVSEPCCFEGNMKPWSAVSQGPCQKQIKVLSEKAQLQIRHQKFPMDKVPKSMSSEWKCQNSWENKESWLRDGRSHGQLNQTCKEFRKCN